MSNRINGFIWLGLAIIILVTEMLIPEADFNVEFWATLVISNVYFAAGKEKANV